jgi:hypothetical protein
MKIITLAYNLSAKSRFFAKNVSWSTVSGSNLLLLALITLPEVLETLSDTTLAVAILRYVMACIEKC